MRYSRGVDEDTALAFVKKYVKSATKTTDLPSRLALTMLATMVADFGDLQELPTVRFVDCD